MGVAVISRTCGDGPFAAERLALGDAEAMLLVDDREAQVLERDGVLDERVGADDDAAPLRPSSAEAGRPEQLERLAPRSPSAVIP